MVIRRSRVTKDSNPSSVDDHAGPQLIIVESDFDLDPEIIAALEAMLDIDPRKVPGRALKQTNKRKDGEEILRHIFLC